MFEDPTEPNGVRPGGAIVKANAEWKEGTPHS